MPSLPSFTAAPLQALYVPKRYKVLYGGRGGAKSWGVARTLLMLGGQKKLNILCARELQKSIDDSVHKLLSNQIMNAPDDPDSPGLGLANFYRIEKAKIYGANGTVFSFEGIKNNVNGIRSYEGVDIVWVEEAVNVSENSWGVLIPTIRKEASEIWLTFNPDLQTDYTYKRFVLDEDLEPVDGEKRFGVPVKCKVLESPDSLVLFMSWRDNPWFPKVLVREMENLRRRDYDEYLHVWEGKCVTQLKGAIYAKELRRAEAEDRITKVPYERSVPVDVFWDLGRADNTAMWWVQRVGMQWRVLKYYENSMQDLNHFLHEAQNAGYVYGTMFLPHDAKHKRLGYPNSVEEQVKARGYKVQIVPSMGRLDGINMARQVFPSCWFDEKQTKDGIEALRHYRYKVDAEGKYSNEPVHDWASDGADAFRYFAVSVRTPREDGTETPARRGLRRLFGNAPQSDAPVGPHGWLG